MAQRKGFFEALLDPSFSDFIAPKIIGILYLVSVIIVVLIAVASILRALAEGIVAGFIVLIIAPLLAFLYIIFFRIGMEAFLATIRTAENTGIIADHLRRNSGF
ncbi:DUF4282 domain-containing protein [Synechococcales cyanobacterium C]|uniref:DUF4282 domain-containing protein n=1 Tax=Petrachloros mirabilis ULC683 TaxID=2781853 RepID=A0A8K2A7R2_9CYAN|nr:DUF4282 domain-containing protein [Petrachloros mirabilis]NCJ07189.1 DUF4282 domain-containing protein [Petrachloros mirabilis ULC683]